MLYAFSLPTKTNKVPTGTDWIHEVKYDAYGLWSSRSKIACA
jgi:ATP-dependent DNA ligase